jgi:hypothetical protein
LERVVSVVGNLRADRLLAAGLRRAEFRQQMGFGPTDTVVLITGSWGPDNLFRKVGPQLLAEASRLMGKYRFVLRLHPNSYALFGEDRQYWLSFVETQKNAGFRISSVEEDMMVPLVGCDIVVSDDLTSMALYAALLQKPLVCVRTGSKQTPEQSYLGRLARIVPELKPGQSLEATLDSTIRNWPPLGLKDLAGEMNSYPGQAKERIVTEIYRLLEFQRPIHRERSMLDA